MENKIEVDVEVERILNTIYNHYGTNDSVINNHNKIKELLYQYVYDNRSCSKLIMFLSDLRVIRFLEDRNIYHLLQSLVNTSNRYGLSLVKEAVNFKLLFDVSKHYMDYSRGQFDLFDNSFVSNLINLNINYGAMIDADMKKLFFIYINNNYNTLKSIIRDEYRINVFVQNVYHDFINDEYFKNYNFYNPDSSDSDLEKIYQDIDDYMSNYINSSNKNYYK